MSMKKLWKVHFNFILRPTQKCLDDYGVAMKKSTSFTFHSPQPRKIEDRLIVVASDTHKDASNAAETAAARWITDQSYGDQWKAPEIEITKIEIFRNADDQPYEFAWV